jgi:hypothetical protein
MLPDVVEDRPDVTTESTRASLPGMFGSRVFLFRNVAAFLSDIAGFCAFPFRKTQ